jgi:hypothetical protein
VPAADGNRFASKLRIVALFDRRIEGIHVDMDDFADGLVGVGHAISLSYSDPGSLGITTATSTGPAR